MLRKVVDSMEKALSNSEMLAYLNKQEVELESKFEAVKREIEKEVPLEVSILNGNLDRPKMTSFAQSARRIIVRPTVVRAMTMYQADQIVRRASRIKLG